MTRRAQSFRGGHENRYDDVLHGSIFRPGRFSGLLALTRRACSCTARSGAARLLTQKLKRCRAQAEGAVVAVRVDLRVRLVLARRQRDKRMRRRIRGAHLNLLRAGFSRRKREARHHRQAYPSASAWMNDLLRSTIGHVGKNLTAAAEPQGDCLRADVPERKCYGCRIARSQTRLRDLSVKP